MTSIILSKEYVYFKYYEEIAFRLDTKQDAGQPAKFSFEYQINPS